MSDGESIHLRLIIVVMVVMLLKMLLDLPIRESKHFEYLNESGVTIIFGVVIGGLGYVFANVLHWTNALIFDPTVFQEVFSLVLLPPIIFNAGFTMKKRNFFKNMGSILVFAVIGCGISAIFIGLGLYYASKYHLIEGFTHVDPFLCLLFGSLLSATDPVATLAVFQEMNLDPTLYSLVFGESVLNDAISIVLFRTFSNFLHHPNLTASSIGDIFLHFLTISLGSILVGVVVSIIGALISKRLAKYMPPQYEILTILIVGFLSYFAAEVMTLSGIMALFVCSVMMSHYHWYNISTDAQITLLNMSSSISFLAESFVFLSLGFLMFHTDASRRSWNWSFIGFTLLLTILSRFFNIFPLSLLLNFGRKKDNKITMKYQMMLWFAGLRGAIALILCLSIKDTVKYKHVFVNCTLFLVLLTNIIMAPFTKPLAKLLKIKVSSKNENVRTMQDNREDSNASSFNDLSNLQPKKYGKVHTFWRTIDEKYVKPLLGGRPRDLFEDEVKIEEEVLFPSPTTPLPVLRTASSAYGTMAASIRRPYSGSFHYSNSVLQ